MKRREMAERIEREMAERIERLEAQVQQLRDDAIKNLNREAETLEIMARLAARQRRPDVEIIGPTNADLRELDRRLTHHRSGRPREHGTTP